MARANFSFVQLQVESRASSLRWPRLQQNKALLLVLDAYKVTVHVVFGIDLIFRISGLNKYLATYLQFNTSISYVAQMVNV